MAESIELLNTQEPNQIEKYFTLENNIETINRMSPYGNVALHVANYYGYNEIFQLFLTNNAFTSLVNISSQSTVYGKSKRDEIENLVLKTFNLHDFQEEIPDNDYIDWSPNGDNLIKKAKEFRTEMDLYKTYDNQHHFITKLLFEIIEYYLKEYLIQQENFSKEAINKLEFCFKKAIEERNYLKYFIKAYTLTNNFHRVLNKHLALYILDYFDPQSYSSLPTKYRLINCLAHIVTLLINHPDIDKYKYKGITYRGLLMKENDLKSYSIGNYILNKSFVSTSKNRSVAEIFSGNRHLGETSDHHDLKQVPVLFKYIIKQNKTGIDIEHISRIQDEEEVLILPFSVFQVKDRIENCPTMYSTVLVEIDLEECEDNEQINNDEQIDNEKQKNKSLASLRHRSKCLYVSIGLCIMFSLIVAGGFIIKTTIKSNSEPQIKEGTTSTQTSKKPEWNTTKSMIVERSEHTPSVRTNGSVGATDGYDGLSRAGAGNCNGGRNTYETFCYGNLTGNDRREEDAKSCLDTLIRKVKFPLGIGGGCHTHAVGHCNCTVDSPYMGRYGGTFEEAHENLKKHCNLFTNKIMERYEGRTEPNPDLRQEKRFDPLIVTYYSNPEQAMLADDDPPPPYNSVMQNIKDSKGSD